MASAARKPRVDEATRIARALLPHGQAELHAFRAVDVANHTESDQRHMVRSGEKRTIRRLSQVERLRIRWGLDPDEARACQWYADAFEARYSTIGTTAKYGDQRGGSPDFDHLPKTPDQDTAGGQLAYAREGISPNLRPMFDRVVIHGFDMDRGAAVLFRLAARQLMHRIEGWM